MYINFLTMISISLFYNCKNVFNLMNIWKNEEKFNETLLPEKDFYSHLNMKVLTDAGTGSQKELI